MQSPARRRQEPGAREEREILSGMVSVLCDHVGLETETPAAGLAAADLAKLIAAANGVQGSHPLARLYEAHAPRAVAFHPGSACHAFGVRLALAWLGDGGLPDVVIPQFNVTLDGDELSWEGGIDEPEANPGEIEVLLLEDDPALQKSTSRMLRKILGEPSIVVVDNVGAAIATLEAHPGIGLIISDVDVIGPQSGLDLFAWVSANRPDLVDRYVFFTGNMAAQDAHYRVVMKPAGVAELRAGIEAPAPIQNPAPRRNPPPSTCQIVELVREVLPSIQTEMGPTGRPFGRFGDRKVFIAAIWRALEEDDRMEGVDEPTFKRALLAAQRGGDLVLARADLVAAMDPEEVMASEIEDRGATFHFVLDEDTERRPAKAKRAPRARRAPAPAAPPPPPAMPPTAVQIAKVVRDALPAIQAETGPDGRPRGRFGPEKVFIAAIWRRVRHDPRLAGMTERDFKRLLIQANRESALDLARADLVGAMDPTEVAQSEVSHMGATFHFVLDPEGRW